MSHERDGSYESGGTLRQFIMNIELRMACKSFVQNIKKNIRNEIISSFIGLPLSGRLLFDVASIDTIKGWWEESVPHSSACNNSYHTDGGMFITLWDRPKVALFADGIWMGVAFFHRYNENTTIFG